MRFTFETEFASPVSRVWPHVSNTDRMNAAAGLPPVTYRDEPQPDGRSRRFCSCKAFRIPVAYEEHPYCWEHESRYDVLREYVGGPIRSLRFGCAIAPAPAGCVVRTRIEVEPRGLLGRCLAWLLVGKITVARLRAYFRRLGEELARPGAAESGAVESPVPVVGETADARQRELIAKLAAQLAEQVSPELARRLETLLLQAPAYELQRLQALRYARLWKTPREETLHLFFAAVRVGLLRMRWDVICPHCRGDKQNLDSLSQVGEQAFCPACNLRFEIDLGRSLEVVFVPHPAVREVESSHYCLGGPGSTPHIYYQNVLAPGESYEPQVRVPAGRYRARFSGEDRFRWLVAGPGERRANGARIVVKDGTLEGEDLRLREGVPQAVRVENASGRTVLAVIERLDWVSDALSAGEMLADQEFRDLFSSQVLAPRVRLSVERATILFTDLVGSTAMYGKLGDAKAFNLVWSHFDLLHDVVKRHQGAIVKTIGDAIMAIFMVPENAVLAAADLHRLLPEHMRARGHDQTVTLKVGLHEGPCIAVNLNDRVDYFGTTVNLAARVQAQSEGEDIVVTRELAERTDGCRALLEAGWTGQAIEAQAKGFDQPIPLLRFTRAGAPHDAGR